MEENETIITGNHLELTGSLKTFVRQKTDKLFRHEPRIIRVRVELEHDRTRTGKDCFKARGIVEIHGPDMVATESGDEMHKVVDIMVAKLDRMIRNRARQGRAKRANPQPVDLSASIPKTDKEST